MPLPIALRLAVRQWLSRPLRPILCSLAIAAAVALIVCVGACFDSIRYSLTTTIGQMLGVAEIHVRIAQRGTDARISSALLEQLRHRPEVELADGRMQSHGALTFGTEHRWFDAFGIDPLHDDLLRPKIYAAGHQLTGKPDEIIADATVADLMKMNVGDILEFTADGSATRTVTLVGIIKRPAIELIAKPTFYMPVDMLAKDLARPPEYDVLDLKLRESVNIEDYDAYARQLNKDLGPSVRVMPGTNSKAKLAEQTRAIQLGLALLSTISGLCAALIIGTTLSVGVQERVRQFGQLRCIGASRPQLAAFLAGDALVMLLLGEALGLILGFVLSALLVGLLPQFFVTYKISTSSLLIAAANGCIATLVGAVIPMWQVTRVSPMAAVTAVAQRARSARIWLAAVIGLACLLFQVLLWNSLPTPELRFYSYVFLGVPCIFLGWSLLGPAALILLENVGSAIIGRALFIRPVLLRSAWSRTPWRAAAMIAALMIGVTLFTSVRARGQSILVSRTLPARFPDLFMLSLVPLSPRQIDKLQTQNPEFAQVTGLAAFPVRIKPSPPAHGADIIPHNATTFVAVDPAAFADLVEMQFVQGDPRTAIEQLASGSHIFISQDFHAARGLGLGDKLTFLAADGKPVDFTIAAVVSSTGMDMVKNYFDMRAAFQDASASSVLGSVADARKYFRLGEVNMLLANLTPQAANPQATAALRQKLLPDLQSVSSVELKSSIRTLISHVVDALTIIAFGALCVASLGVANMVIASVHARRFEFGVLRAVGAGRGQLIRLVLAEVTLIGIVAGILGAAAGLHFTFMATAIDQLLVGFHTHFLATSPATILLNMLQHVLLAVALTTLLAWLASIVPAARGAFSAQRTLLASGRV